MLAAATRNKVSFIFILMCILAAYTIFTWAVPLYSDDYMYLTRWNAATDSGDLSFSNFIRFIKRSRNVDNFRISNMLAPFAVEFEPWKTLFPIFNGIVFCTLTFIGYRIITGFKKTCNSLFLVLTWAFLIVFMPWNEIFIRIFSLNYPWAALVTLIFLIFLFKRIPFTHNRLVIFCGCALGVVAGGWHEGFSLPSLCGIFCYALYKKWRLPRKFYLCAAIYALSALFFLWSPGMIYRIQVSVGDFNTPTQLRVFLALLILLALLIVALFSRTGRRRIQGMLREPSFIVGFGIIISGIALAYLTDNQPRCYFWVDLISLILLGRVIYAFRGNCSRGIKVAATLIILGLCLAQSVLAIIFQINIKRHTAEIVNLIEQSPSGVAFYDFPTVPQYRWWNFNMPLFKIWVDVFQYQDLKEYFNKPFTSLVPAELQNANMTNLTPMDNDGNFYYFKNHLISSYAYSSHFKYQFNIPIFHEMNFTLRNGTVINKKVFTSPFVSHPYSHDDGSFRSDTLYYYTLTDMDLKQISTIRSAHE